jgi:hypothetical protein
MITLHTYRAVTQSNKKLSGFSGDLSFCLCPGRIVWYRKINSYSREGEFMKKVRLIISITLALVPVLSPCTSADYVSDQKGTLRGIEALLIVVGQLPPEVTDLGLTKEQVRTEVAERVRLSGITVVPLEAFPTLDPYLYITINTASRQPYLSYSLHSELKQLVYLGRDKDTSCDATTWTGTKAGITERTHAKSEIMGNIRQLVERFITDHAAANDKEAVKPPEGGGDGR